MSPVRSHRSSVRRSRHSRSRSTEGKYHSNDKGNSRKAEKEKQDYRKYERSYDLSKDSERTRDRIEDKATPRSVGSPKRRSVSPDNEKLEPQKSGCRHKRSKLDNLSIEKGDTVKKTRMEGGDLESNRDKVSTHPTTSKQHKSSEVIRDNKHVENQDSRSYEGSRTKHRKHDKGDSISKEEKKTSHHSNSRSHRSSGHLRESSLKKTVGLNKEEKNKEGIVNPDEHDVISWEFQISNDNMKKNESDSKLEPCNSSPFSSPDEFLSNSKASIGEKNNEDAYSIRMRENSSISRTSKLSQTEVNHVESDREINDHIENKESGCQGTVGQDSTAGTDTVGWQETTDSIANP